MRMCTVFIYKKMILVKVLVLCQVMSSHDKKSKRNGGPQERPPMPTRKERQQQQQVHAMCSVLV
jgi:hypothetical protein